MDLLFRQYRVWKLIFLKNFILILIFLYLILLLVYYCKIFNIITICEYFFDTITFDIITIRYNYFRYNYLSIQLPFDIITFQHEIRISYYIWNYFSILLLFSNFDIIPFRYYYTLPQKILYFLSRFLYSKVTT